MQSTAHAAQHERSRMLMLAEKREEGRGERHVQALKSRTARAEHVCVCRHIRSHVLAAAHVPSCFFCV